MMTDLSDLPVSVIAGYLGSGKTTFINQRLQESNGIRYGILVNDFGDLNIDEALIESADANTVSLTNGCVCCSISHDVERALGEIREIANEIDWVLFEASGVADPARLQSQVENWPGFHLADTLTLVDATRIQRLVNDKFVGGHIRAQLKTGSRQHLTKTDLLSESAISEITQWLDALRANPDSGCNHSLPNFHAQSFYQHSRDAAVQIQSWLEALPKSVVRVKGFVETESGAKLLQYVEGHYELNDIPPDTGVSNMLGRLVVIAAASLDSLQPPKGFSREERL